MVLSTRATKCPGTVGQRHRGTGYSGTGISRPYLHTYRDDVRCVGEFLAVIAGGAIVATVGVAPTSGNGTRPVMGARPSDGPPNPRWTILPRVDGPRRWESGGRHQRWTDARQLPHVRPVSSHAYDDYRRNHQKMSNAWAVIGDAITAITTTATDNANSIACVLAHRTALRGWGIMTFMSTTFPRVGNRDAAPGHR